MSEDYNFVNVKIERNSSGFGETRDIRNTRRSGTGQVGLDLLDLGVPRGRSPKSPEGIGQVGYWIFRVFCTRYIEVLK